MTLLQTEPTTAADLAVAEIEAQRDRLLAKLRDQRRDAAALWAWYHGEQPEPVVPGRYRDAYRLLLEIARTPWARLVVDTVAERLHVQGFRSSGGVENEQSAWDLFLASSLDADEWLVYTEALISGVGYVSVVGETVVPESVFEVTHEPTPGNRREVAGAVKVYPEAWEGTSWVAELYRPEATYRWTTEIPRDGRDDGFPLDGREEVAWTEADEFVSENALGEVPVVPFENRATIIGGGVSELADCVPILRRIDRLTLDKMLSSDVAAFKQKWATGLEVPRDPETGNPVEPFKAAVDRLWISENAETRFGSFDATDLGQYLKAIDAEIAALAAISRVPAHYLLQQNLANPPSAESLVAAESGLVAKVRERQRRFGEAWERVVRLAQGGGDAPSLEVVWADAEMRNPAQVADAAVKLDTIGVPQRALWEYVGATPQQIAEWTVEAAAAALVAAATAPPATGTTPP